MAYDYGDRVICKGPGNDMLGLRALTGYHSGTRSYAYAYSCHREKAARLCYR